VKVTDEDLETNAKDIISAANKYGVPNLKLAAEACLVKSAKISIENMMDLLLDADAMNCALLKEAVMDFIIQNKADVISKVSFKDVPGEIVTDVLVAVTRGEKSGTDGACDKDQLCTMGITDLRRKVHEKGLEIDGSREALIAALNRNT